MNAESSQWKHLSKTLIRRKPNLKFSCFKVVSTFKSTVTQTWNVSENSSCNKYYFCESNFTRNEVDSFIDIEVDPNDIKRSIEVCS